MFIYCPQWSQIKDKNTKITRIFINIRTKQCTSKKENPWVKYTLGGKKADVELNKHKTIASQIWEKNQCWEIL